MDVSARQRTQGGQWGVVAFPGSRWSRLFLPGACRAGDDRPRYGVAEARGAGVGSRAPRERARRAGVERKLRPIAFVLPAALPRAFATVAVRGVSGQPASGSLTGPRNGSAVDERSWSSTGPMEPAGTRSSTLPVERPARVSRRRSVPAAPRSALGTGAVTKPEAAPPTAHGTVPFRLLAALPLVAIPMAAFPLVGTARAVSGRPRPGPARGWPPAAVPACPARSRTAGATVAGATVAGVARATSHRVAAVAGSAPLSHRSPPRGASAARCACPRPRSRG